jgi:hypothetical protein
MDGETKGSKKKSTKQRFFLDEVCFFANEKEFRIDKTRLL